MKAFIALLLTLPSLLMAQMDLVDYAKSCLNEIYVEEKHFVVAAIRTKSGKIYTGFNLKTTATRASICAESIALAKAIESFNTDIETIVVVARLNNSSDVQIVTPCGICRELLLDYAPEASVIISVNEIPTQIAVSDLLVFPYKRKA